MKTTTVETILIAVGGIATGVLITTGIGAYIVIAVVLMAATVWDVVQWRRRREAES